MEGGSGHDRMGGEYGQDALYGQAGNDSPRGHTSGDGVADRLPGGTGIDILADESAIRTTTLFFFVPKVIESNRDRPVEKTAEDLWA